MLDITLATCVVMLVFMLAFRPFHMAGVEANNTPPRPFTRFEATVRSDVIYMYRSDCYCSHRDPHTEPGILDDGTYVALQINFRATGRIAAGTRVFGDTDGVTYKVRGEVLEATT